MNKAKLNYWVDVVIGMAGAISALTGLILLLPADSASGILGISLRVWSSAHTWSSLAAVAGVGVHLALHWKWAMAMTGQMLATTNRRAVTGTTSEPELEAGGAPLSRRALLALGGMAAVGAGLAAAGYKVIAEATSTGAAEGDNATTGVAQASGVACPRGLVNDPYPGQCRHFVDSDGDGICDYSVVGSGSQITGNVGGGPGGAFAGRHGSWGRP